MKCPYCNKILKIIKFNDTFTCLNPNCKQSLGMIGTKLMWEKVESLHKIRKCTSRYYKENKEKRNAYMREYYARKKTEKKEKL